MKKPNKSIEDKIPYLKAMPQFNKLARRVNKMCEENQRDEDIKNCPSPINPCTCCRYKPKKIISGKLDETLRLAKFLHEEYENQARLYNWETQKKCRVNFEDLPEANKKTMFGIAQQILKYYLPPILSKSNKDLIDKIEKECIYEDTDGIHSVIITRIDMEKFNKLKQTYDIR